MPTPPPDLLLLDPAATVAAIARSVQHQVGDRLKRRGLVIGMSGGIDSSVCAALAVRSLGAHRVFALLMPERDSDPHSLELARDWARQLGVTALVEDITPALEACGCYRRRNDAIRSVVPDFEDHWGCKIVLPGDRLASDRLNIFSLVVQPPQGGSITVRLPSEVYRTVVAATNFKQRVRKMMEYFHADRLHYAVIGTPNRLEYDQGFFVKGGDGLADVKPIAHLYKTQVYQLAEHLGVPAAIVERPPTTDTYSLPQTQEEFYFSLSAADMDSMLFAYNAGWTPESAGEALGQGPASVARAYLEIERKRSTTRYLHEPPLLVEQVHPNGG